MHRPPSSGSSGSTALTIPAPPRRRSDAAHARLADDGIADLSECAGDQSLDRSGLTRVAECCRPRWCARVDCDLFAGNVQNSRDQPFINLRLPHALLGTCWAAMVRCNMEASKSRCQTWSDDRTKRIGAAGPMRGRDASAHDDIYRTDRDKPIHPGSAWQERRCQVLRRRAEPGRAIVAVTAREARLAATAFDDTRTLRRISCKRRAFVTAPSGPTNSV